MIMNNDEGGNVHVVNDGRGGDDSDEKDVDDCHDSDVYGGTFYPSNDAKGEKEVFFTVKSLQGFILVLIQCVELAPDPNGVPAQNSLLCRLHRCPLLLCSLCFHHLVANEQVSCSNVVITTVVGLQVCFVKKLPVKREWQWAEECECGPGSGCGSPEGEVGLIIGSDCMQMYSTESRRQWAKVIAAIVVA